jgi:hypothetical protein
MSLRRGFPGSQWQQPGNARQFPQHHVRPLQDVPICLSTSPPSMRPCLAAVARPTCASAVFPWR